MKVITTVHAMQAAASRLRGDGRTIGMVPTMGALHDGHLALLSAARAAHDAVVVSIFVNPAQFGPEEDFHRYPRDLDEDTRQCEAASADLVFAPPVEEVYPPGFQTVSAVGGESALGGEVGRLGAIMNILEGRTRPGHFRGVATVITRLIDIIRPHRVYVGQKDYQQAVLVRQLVRDLTVDIEVIVIPTVRAADGLALSSRHTYLTAEARSAAAVLYQALEQATSLVRSGEREVARLREAVTQWIARASLVRLDYVEVCDLETLEPLHSLTAGVRAVVLLAAWVGREPERPVRLIDNVLLTPP